MLYNGEQIGDGSPPQVDIAVDPLEGTTLAANGMPSALAVIALSRPRHDVRPGPVRVHGEDGRRARDRRPARPRPPARRDRARWSPSARARPVGDVMVVVLDRPRHEQGIAAIREAGARVRLIPHGDVSAALLAVTERSPVDLLWGIGGTPEGVISAAAVKCLGGQLLGRLWPRDERERSRRARGRLRPRASARSATTWWPARTCSSPPPASPTATCCRACATRAPAARRPSRW